MQTKSQILDGIQSTEAKQNVRNEIMGQIVKYAKQCKTDINFTTLPSTGWLFEKGSKNGVGLIETCKKNGIKLKVTGIENSDNKEVVRAFRKNAPKFATTVRGDFDYWVSSLCDKGPTHGTNVVWADYCGNPAEIGHSSNPAKTRYSYPHILLFKDIVAVTNKPMLYFMTFHCNGRIKGGADKMRKALSPNASSIHVAIRHKISQTLHTYKLSHKAKMIMDIYYHGSGNSFMVTIGFAINFNPRFPVIKENWVKQDAKIKAAKTDYVKVDWTGIKKEAMKALCDMGWATEKIAYALGTQKTKVGSVLAWHKHRDSWNKKVA